MVHYHIGNTLIHPVDKTFGTVPSVSIDHFAEEVQRHACHDEHLDQSDFHEKSKIYFFPNFYFSKKGRCKDMFPTLWYISKECPFELIMIPDYT